MPANESPLVGIVMGSKSDWEYMAAAAEIMTELKIPHEKKVLSAHRTPDLTLEYAAGAKARGATIRLGGQVAVGSVKLGDGVSNLEFDVTDGTATVHVVSRGVPPQLFRDRIGVVVEGALANDGTFESRRLMVSHDNKYRAPGDRNAEIKELMRSTQGLDELPPASAAVAGSRP